MKKNKSLAELSLDELQSKKKLVQAILIAQGILMLLSSAVLIYLSITTNKKSLNVVSVASIITLLPSLIIFNQICAEIKLRQLK